MEDLSKYADDQKKSILLINETISKKKDCINALIERCKSEIHSTFEQIKLKLDNKEKEIINNTTNILHKSIDDLDNYDNSLQKNSGNLEEQQRWDEAIEKADIAAVGTYFNDTGVDYEFKIYVNDVLKLTQNGISEFAGFRTIKLNKMVPIQEYDTFKVVFKSNNVPYQEKSRQHLLEEMSYVSSDANTWIDFSKENRTVCLKAYTLDSKNRIITENLVKIYKNDSAFVAYIGMKTKQ